MPAWVGRSWERYRPGSVDLRLRCAIKGLLSARTHRRSHFQPGTDFACSIHFSISGSCASSRVLTLT